MTTVYDVPVDMFIRTVAEELKKQPEIEPPEWAAFAKTGVHKQMPPKNPDWWFVRTASILRRVYVDGPIGVERMRSIYGGKQDRGSKPYRFRKGSGSILRKALQQLEAAGFVTKDSKGRKISPAGASFLDGVAYTIKSPAIEAVPELVKY
jgi:small subunit ribosomal protein S19e